MGDIGKPRKFIILEPLDVPGEQPVAEPAAPDTAPAPAAPAREPVPA